jgi:hypothetical protein
MRLGMAKNCSAVFGEVDFGFTEELRFRGLDLLLLPLVLCVMPSSFLDGGFCRRKGPDRL